MTTERTPGALGSNDQLGAVSEAGRTTIADDDVYWLMTWGERYPDKPPTELMFEEGKALARLLAEEVLFLNSHWWEKDWPERAQKITSLNVNCNDIFAWACADAEEIEHSEIQGLYDLWRADRTWGAAKWCAIKRRQQPQPPVIAAMKNAGAWDACMEALVANTQDAEVQAMFAALRAPNVGGELTSRLAGVGQLER